MADEEVIYEDMNVDELKEELRARGLSVSGNKDELIARLDEDDAAEAEGEVTEEPEYEEPAEVDTAAVEETTETLDSAREAFDITAKELEDAARDQQLALAEASRAGRVIGEARAAQAQAEAAEAKAAREAEREQEKAAQQAEREAARAAEREEEVA